MKNFKVTQSITDRSNDCVKSYLKEINKYPILSPEEEQVVAKAASEGDEIAFNKLINSNLRFVVSVAKQYQNDTLSLLDLINEGNIGLIKAAHKFDYTRGFKFISYAVWWIRQSIMQAISDKAKTIRIPTNQGALINKVSKAISQFEQQNNRSPSYDEISAIPDIAEEKIGEIMAIMTKTVSVDTPFGDEEDGCLLDVIPNFNVNPTDSNLSNISKTEEMNRVLNKLPIRESAIIQMFFGLNGIQEMPFEEIGKRFGLTGERIRQLKEKTLKNLKDNYSEQLKRI